MTIEATRVSDVSSKEPTNGFERSFFVVSTAIITQLRIRGGNPSVPSSNREYADFVTILRTDVGNLRLHADGTWMDSVFNHRDILGKANLDLLLLKHALLSDPGEYLAFFPNFPQDMADVEAVDEFYDKVKAIEPEYLARNREKLSAEFIRNMAHALGVILQTPDSKF